MTLPLENSRPNRRATYAMKQKYKANLETARISTPYDRPAPLYRLWDLEQLSLEPRRSAAKPPYRRNASSI